MKRPRLFLFFSSLFVYKQSLSYFLFSQGHKAEIDAREDNFGDCITLGKELLSRNHYASNEIKDKLVGTTNDLAYHNYLKQ